MLVPILLALGVVGLVYSTRKKVGATPSPVPMPTQPGGIIPNVPPDMIPNIPPNLPGLPQLPGQGNVPSGFNRNPLYVAPPIRPEQSRYNPLFVARDVTGNCNSIETWIPITDPRISRYPHLPVQINANGERGVCVLTQYLPQI